MPVSRADRLAQIRALRAAGKTGFDAYEVQEAESIYDTVDDEGYKKVVRGRLDQDDFVVDDKARDMSTMDGRIGKMNDARNMTTARVMATYPSRAKLVSNTCNPNVKVVC